jgi:hypothetical protein
VKHQSPIGSAESVEPVSVNHGDAEATVSTDSDENEAHDRPTVRRLGGAYGLVYASIVRDPHITPQAKALYALLASYADRDERDCYPSVTTLSKQMGASRATIQRWMAELRASGVLRVEARYRSDGGQGANTYWLDDRWPRPGRDAPPGITDGAHPRVTDEAQNRTRRNKTSKSSSSALLDDLPDEYKAAEFWRWLKDYRGARSPKALFQSFDAAERKDAIGEFLETKADADLPDWMLA